MEGLLVLGLVVIGMILFGAFALAYGVDSRVGFADRRQREAGLSL